MNVAKESVKFIKSDSPNFEYYALIQRPSRGALILRVKKTSEASGWLPWQAGRDETMTGFGNTRFEAVQSAMSQLEDEDSALSRTDLIQQEYIDEAQTIRESGAVDEDATWTGRSLIRTLKLEDGTSYDMRYYQFIEDDDIVWIPADCLAKSPMFTDTDMSMNFGYDRVFHWDDPEEGYRVLILDPEGKYRVDMVFQDRYNRDHMVESHIENSGLRVVATRFKYEV